MKVSWELRVALSEAFPLWPTSPYYTERLMEWCVHICILLEFWVMYLIRINFKACLPHRTVKDQQTMVHRSTCCVKQFHWLTAIFIQLQEQLPTVKGELWEKALQPTLPKLTTLWPFTEESDLTERSIELTHVCSRSCPGDGRVAQWLSTCLAVRPWVPLPAPQKQKKKKKQEAPF